METLIIKVKDSKVSKLIHDIEALGLIQIVSTNVKEPKAKLSTMLSGCITLEQADNRHKELKEMRG